MKDHASSAPTSSEVRQGQRGIFLPTMAWTADRHEVEQAREQLLTLRAHLATLLSFAQECYEQATWWMMAEASLSQLDRDIDDLFEWLEASERQKYSAGTVPAGL